MRFLLPLVISFGFWSTVAHGADWPQFRGPTVQGVSSEKGFATSWSIETGKNILWKAPLPKSDNPYSSPVVAGGRVFTTVTINQDREHHVLAWDAATGKPLWDKVVEPGPWLLTDLRGGYNAPTPCSDGKAVYALFGSCVLAALEAENGKPLWRYEIKNSSFDVAVGTSPILYKDMVIIVADQTQKKSRMLAIDKATGQVRYDVPRPHTNFAHSTPVPVQVDGKTQLLVAASETLEGIDPETGKIIWSFKTQGDAASPVFADGITYIDSGRGSNGVGVRVDGTNQGDVSKTHLLWKTDKKVPETLSSAVIADGLLYRVISPGILKCIELKTGREIYSQRLEGLSPWPSPVATADGLIYLASGGTSYVVRAGEKYELLATNALKDANHASPAFAERRIYLKGKNALYCVGEK